MATLRWTATIRVTVLHRDGHHEVEEFPNLIVNSGKNHLRNCLGDPGGFDPYTGVNLKVCALGSGTTTPAVTQTQLTTEVFRKAITSYESPAVGQVRTITYIAPGEANFAIREIGWFAYDAYDSAPNSGIMVARVLYSRTKTNLEALQVERLDTIS
jgi:hypothetical protein